MWKYNGLGKYFMDNVLRRQGMTPFRRHQALQTFQHDNDRAHTARVSIARWLALSPGLSQVEHLWGMTLKLLVCKSQPRGILIPPYSVFCGANQRNNATSY